MSDVKNDPKLVHIFDLTFSVYASLDHAADAVVDFDSAGLAADKLPFLVTPNVDYIVNWDKPEFRSLRSDYSRSAFILVDGHPLVAFSKITGKSLVRRLPGSSLFPLAWDRIKRSGKKAFLILANEELCRFYNNEYENVRTYCPISFDAKDRKAIDGIVADCRKIIEEQKPDFVFAGIQFPKQDIIVLELYRSLDVPKMPLFLLLGASMAFYAGQIKRSPIFFQVIGMEWFYRLCQQPRRMFKRYLIDDMAIFGIFFKELFRKNGPQ